MIQKIQNLEPSSIAQGTGNCLYASETPLISLILIIGSGFMKIVNLFKWGRLLYNLTIELKLKPMIEI